ncbi:class I SAM-dependent methyltransferase [Agrobacterium sp. a22-2]|uniref:class I SAM-dependent methyltransferase n=1 Tax=Agrobacterium sp. a22-2 TaxID=2283840 RepID=UPI00210FC32A|nr:class I SAM-dependent methyltransferase [Agrobacterium sp. a22-2]
MSPATLRLACLCNAVEAQIPDEPSYLELGFGQGVSINMHAAASTGAYWGTDFNPSQTVEARKFAEASGANIHLFDDSFEEFATRDDLPDFDVIALHGIWSWISQKNRATITDIIRRKLRPGGVAYISYNCLPGWAPAIPIRKLMSLYRDYGTAKMANPNEMIDGALQSIEEIAGAGSAYFRENPAVRHHVKAMAQQGRSYLAHEYLNADWHLEHFADMVHSLDDAKLTYVGSARLLDGIDYFQMEDAAIKLIARVGHPVMRETVRDYMISRRFRTDVFVKGARLLSSVEHRDAWNAQLFVLSRSLIDIPKKIACGRGEVELPTEKYDRIIEAMSDHGYRPKTAKEIYEHKSMRSLNQQDVISMLTVLTGAGFASPAQVPSARVMEQCRALNAYILQRARISSNLRYMVSPVTGGGITLPHMAQLFVIACSEGETNPEVMADRVWQFLEASGERVVRDGKRIESRSENLKEVLAAANRFLSYERPLLEALEVIDRDQSSRA